MLACFVVRWRSHLCQQGLWGNVLLMGPRHGTEQYADLIEILHVLQFLENASVKIWLQVKDALAAIFQLNVNLVISKRFHLFHIPIHTAPHKGASNLVWMLIADRQFL